MRRRLIILSATILISFEPLLSQPAFFTVAESSDFKSTSNYNDVMSFIEKLKKSSKYLRVETIARSAEGRDVPLLIIGKPLPKSTVQMKNDGRIVIYIQANIHAGEVEGKEASLMFARDLLSEKDPDLLNHAVILICPNFNPDGNEKISPENRTHQNGPVNGVGLRYNGQMLDLNRDGMKAESPEVRGLITRVFNTWDPDIFMDCHTTDGSFHVEPVTFTWMVNPNGDNSLIKYMRTKMIPEMSGTLLNKYKVENCYYGEFNDMMDPESGWFYDAAEPRYLVNYFGLRNRLAILNENYVYADYKSRVLGCYYLIKSLADYATVHKAEIMTMLKKTDEKTISRGLNPAVTDSFAIEYKVRPLDEKVTIKTFEAERTNKPNVYPPFRRTERRKDVTVPYYIDYYSSKNVRFPFAYLINNNDPEVISLLRTQGIIVEKLTEALESEAERFEISELTGSRRLNQGHYTNMISGRFIKMIVVFPSGTLVIRSAQPLANLASYLLEPQSNDGLMTWNYFDRYLVPQWGTGYNAYPVYKIMSPIEIKSVFLP
ncbi:MAG: M14 family metallopeptidase [Bacteroidia bacterium]|nr:M14 family metallopeptidase [Bacteroidia bacterium]